ncbi:hypothetical protein PR202_ga02907 [Eleusine coracana subsp. coracana]|uniref:Uncharacterized protein n=1 Tax=Eleusine coracana subsp. coracana TaxID=191504 RepID=A0AAV5BNJ9_ELECO|nr:hypothetical protein PR202_ga02907 [Eleusine coracana subsp. coracana]
MSSILAFVMCLSMVDVATTPIRDGMRTPMPSRAWVPMSPPRDNWEDGNPTTWASSPTYQPGSRWTPPSRPYEAPTPGSGWASTTGVGFGEASGNASNPYVPWTPAGQASPDPASYSPATPGGQPLTPGNVGMDVISPVIGAEGEGNWLLPDVLVNVSRLGGGDTEGVVKEVLQNLNLEDGSCLVALGSMGSGGEVIAAPNEVEIVRPNKNERVKIMNGSMRGETGRLIGVDGSDSIVRVEKKSEMKIVDMMVLGKVSA